MRIQTAKFQQASFRTDVLIMPLLKGDLRKSSKKTTKRGSLSLDVLERELKTDFRSALKKEGFEGAELKSALFRTPQSKKMRAVVFIGVPTEKDLEKKSTIDRSELYRKLGAQVFNHAKATSAEKVAIATEALQISDRILMAALIEGMTLSGYSFNRYKKKKSKPEKHIKNVTFVSSATIARGATREGSVLADSTALARDLVNMPACDCTPAFLVKKAREIGRKDKLRVQVFDRARLKKLGAGSLLSVSEGSQQPPYLIKLTYTPAKKNRKVISLVGKGVTFDSGGLSIKTGGGMMDMKCDMAGAATVIATMQAVAKLKPAVEVRGYVPATENMINGKATRPGDVVKASNGKTIEILNTDAEGRLILADALCMAEKDGCDQIIDLATLTGACMVALGGEYAGLFSTSDQMVAGLREAGEQAGERLWHLPLAPEYKKQLESPVADIKNIGGGHGGAITAALFLQHFVEKTDWAHLDIAGPAFVASGSEYITKGGVGFGVRTLVRYLQGL